MTSSIQALARSAGVFCLARMMNLFASTSTQHPPRHSLPLHFVAAHFPRVMRNCRVRPIRDTECVSRVASTASPISDFANHLFMRPLLF